MDFAQTFNKVAKDAHETAIDKGWWTVPKHPGVSIVLIHAELSEAVEALRENNWHGEGGATEELADVIIRIMDFAEYYKLNLGDAIVAKMEKNKERPVRHGGKLF